MLTNIIKITNCEEYLTYLCENINDCIIVVAGNDNSWFFMPESAADLFMRMGCIDLHSQRGLSGQFELAYIAVIDSGELKYEKLADKSEEKISYSDSMFDIISSRYDLELPMYCSIKYRGIEFAGASRGFSILVIDKESGEATDTVSICFDSPKPKFIRPFYVKDIEEYERFRTSFQSENIPKLSLHIPDYPYGETVVINGSVSSDQSEAIKAFCESMRLKLFAFEDTLIVTSDSVKQDINEESYIFHGLARCEDKFIIGSNDIERNRITIKSLREQVGCYALTQILKCEDGVEIKVSTDWFGSQCLFYYQTGCFTVVSTDYHLILLILKKMGEELTLDIPRVLASQSYFNPMMEEGMSYKKDVKGVTEIAADKYAVIKNGRIKFKNTTLFDYTHNVDEYTDEKYEELILKAKDEMIANSRAVFSHPDIDYVRCDLSGGVDSRLVLATIMNLPISLRKKLRIHTEIRNDLSKDYEIASKIVDSLGLQWDEYTDINTVNRRGYEEKKVYAPRFSKQLSINNEFVAHATTCTRKRMIQLCGAYGETLTKPTGYYFASTKKTVAAALKFICSTVDIGLNTRAFQYAKKYIYEFIDDAGSVDVEDIFAYAFLYLHDRHHWPMNIGNRPMWTPLMSKSLYRLKLMYTKKHNDWKLRLDMVAALSPLLSCFEYDNPDTNNAKIALKDRLLSNAEVKVEATYDPSAKVSYSEIQKKRQKVLLPDTQTANSASCLLRSLYDSKQLKLSALKTFLDYSEDFDEIGFQLFSFFNRDCDAVYYQNGFRYEINRIDRLWQIYWQILIISD